MRTNQIISYKKCIYSFAIATDIKSAIAYLKTRPTISKQNIGLIGHSEGGMIAPMVAARSKDVSFIVMLAGPGMPGGELMLLQKELIDRADGIPEDVILRSKEINAKLIDIVMKSDNGEELKKKITDAAIAAYKTDTTVRFLLDQKSSDIANILTNPSVQYAIKYNPEHDLKKVKCPLLALNGEKDLQVPPAENLAGIEKELKSRKNKNFTIKQMTGMNHLFQECNNGSLSEYFTNPQTFSPIALTEISAWILKQTKRKVIKNNDR